MVEQTNILTRGGIYLAKLDPAQEAEAGKIRPITLLTAQTILNIEPPIVFICPLSSQSISTRRIIFPRLAQSTHHEIAALLKQLQQWIDF